MRFITVLTASLAVGSAVAATKEASFQPFTVSGDDIEFNPAVYTTENFTASDGETYEITFLSGAPDVEGRSAFQRRQQDSDDPKNRWRAGSLEKSCPFGSITGDTGPNAPTTGRCISVRDWCAKNPGHWELYRSESLMGYYPLVSSGKTGTTACHFGVRGRSALDVVGSYDVRDWVKSSLDRYRRDFNGVERVRARGEVTRETGGLCRNGVRPYGLDWKLDTLQAMY